MLSPEAVVNMDRALRSQKNQNGLLVMVTNLETEWQRQNSKGANSRIITEQQIGVVFTVHQEVVARGKEPPILYQLMKKTGLRPYNPDWMRIVTNWFLTNRSDMTVDIQGATRLMPMDDVGITTEALKRMSFDLAPGVPVSEFVQRLIEEVNLGVRLTLQPGQGINAFKRVDTPGGEEGACFAMHPFVYPLGISIARSYLQEV